MYQPCGERGNYVLSEHFFPAVLADGIALVTPGAELLTVPLFDGFTALFQESLSPGSSLRAIENGRGRRWCGGVSDSEDLEAWTTVEWTLISGRTANLSRRKATEQKVANGGSVAEGCRL